MDEPKALRAPRGILLRARIPKYKTSLPPVLPAVCIGRAARDIDSYALFGHARVHARAHTHASGICIPDYTSRVDRIAVRAAGSEPDCTYIFMYLSCAVRYVLICVGRYVADNSPMSFLRAELRRETLRAPAPRSPFRSNFGTLSRRARTSDVLSAGVLRGILHDPVLSLAVAASREGRGGREGVIPTAIFRELHGSTATEGRAIRVDRAGTHN